MHRNKLARQRTQVAAGLANWEVTTCQAGVLSDDDRDQLILIRHGESEWNRDHRFTGWADVDLTELGRAQMHDAGALLRREGLAVDQAFTSVLSRCIRSHRISDGADD